jgi:hypothetical protein
MSTWTVMEYLRVVADRMDEAHKQGDSKELMRLTHICIETLREVERKQVQGARIEEED